MNLGEGQRNKSARRVNRCPSWATLWLGWAVLTLIVLPACVGRRPARPNLDAQTRTFVSRNFFSVDYPSDWVTRDLDDGASLFFADELLFVGVKLIEPPDPQNVDVFLSEQIQVDAQIQGGTQSLVRTGKAGGYGYSLYQIEKSNQQKLLEVLLYNNHLQLLYVISGSCRVEDFDEFKGVFEDLLDSFRFRVTARYPSESHNTLEPDLSSIPAVWTTFLEGVRTEDFDLLQKTTARINSTKIMNDSTVRRVKADYFPYSNPIYTFVSGFEVRDRLGYATVSVRSLPPDGYLRHEQREFILEEDQWRLLRFDRVD